MTGVGGADSDTLLERNESLQIDLKLGNTVGSGDDKLDTLLGTNTTFTIEVIPPQGPILFLERSTPINMDLRTNLQ